MTIQYVGFTVAPSFRTYLFRVVETLEQAREFTVRVQLEAFGSSPLKLQDGPDLCLGRLRQELERETQEAHAASHLRIVEQDIRTYVERHYARKRR